MAMHCSDVCICMGEHVCAKFMLYEAFITKPFGITISLGVVYNKGYNSTSYHSLSWDFDCGLSYVEIAFAINTQFSQGSTL